MIETDILRYSPHPIEAYSGTLPDGRRYGPANNKYLANCSKAWNLAYLSHPFEIEAEPDCPVFGQLIQETLDYYNEEGFCFGDLMGAPAPYVVKTLTQGCRGLPMYEVFGRRWLATIDERQWLCRADSEEVEELQVDSTTQLILKDVFRLLK